MRRTIYGIGFLLAVLFLSAGFFLSYQVSQLKERMLSLEEEGDQARQQVSALTKARDRDLIFETYEEGKVKREVYRMTSYGENQVVLRQEKESAAKEDGKEESFLLKIEEGLVVVYREDGKELFEYTDIPLETLPSALQEELLLGKKIESRQALYEFLENYSS